MRYLTILSLSLMTILVGGCDTTRNAGPKQNVGMVLGAVGGAIAGANVGKGTGNVAAIAIGTLLGAHLGNEIGASLDRADLAYHGKAAETAFEYNRTGTASTWNNPDSGNYGTVIPTKTYQTSVGTYCREYTQTIVVGGQEQQGYGTACRQPDGSWKIQES